MPIVQLCKKNWKFTSHSVLPTQTGDLEHWGVWPPGTTRETPRIEECVCKGEGKYFNDFGEMIINMGVCLVWDNHWICRQKKVYKQKLSCIHNAWLLGGAIPLWIWPNKEYLLLNAALVLRSFLFPRIFGKKLAFKTKLLKDLSAFSFMFYINNFLALAKKK